jgi:hypothetical protein
MKRYWPLLAIALMLVAIIGMSQYADSAKRRYEESTRQAKETPVAKNDDRNATNNTENTYKPPVWAKFVTWPEGVGAWALILTLLAIAWQSIETHEAAKTGAEAANAASGSLTMAEAQWKLMIEEKRARLEVDVDRKTLTVESESGIYLRHLIATLKIRNIGESKAYIRRAEGILITKAQDVPLEPDNHPFHSLDIPTPLEPHPDATEVKMYLFLEDTKLETFADCLGKSIFSLHLSGFIEYETLGICYRKEFGYSWNGVVGRHSSLSEMLGLPDPYPNSPMPARDRIKYGAWWRDEEKPEYSISCEQTEEAN